MASRSLNKQLAVTVLAKAALTRPAFAFDLAWNDNVDANGCDGNWHQVQRAHNLRQCLENAKPLRCSLEQMQHRCCA